MRAGERERGGTRGRERRRLARWWRCSPALIALSITLPLTLSQTGCGIYSFTGASIPDHVETVAIPLAEDRSLGGVPNMDQALTDLLIERFVQQTRLVLEPDENAADALLVATIERYQNEPTAVTDDELAALNRVTISVRVTYLDQVEDDERLARSFSANGTYDATNIGQEDVVVLEALEEIADDIFTAATSDW